MKIKKNKFKLIVLSFTLIGIPISIYAETDASPPQNVIETKNEETSPPKETKKEPLKNETKKTEKKKELNAKKQENKTATSSENIINSDKKETDTTQKNTELSSELNLPNVTTTEVEASPYFSNIFKNKNQKNILKTIISWLLIISGIFLILHVI